MLRPLLYTYRRCPYAMRARMALHQAGIGFDAHEIVLRDKPAEMLRLSPKGTVPVLVLPGAEVIDESLDIMRWAFNQGCDAQGWWARSQLANAQAFVAQSDGPFKRLLDAYKYPERHSSNEGPASYRDQAVACLLRPLDQWLAQRPFLSGDEPCAADLAVFPFVRQFRAVDVDWFDLQAMPALQRWLRWWLDSELFDRCMKRGEASTNPRLG